MDNVKKELEEFLEFKKQYKFSQKKLEERDGAIYCDGYLVENEEEKIGESEAWINASYKLKGLSTNLSNSIKSSALFFLKSLKNPP